jgi:single-stranded-DNA-specific exonuclease
LVAVSTACDIVPMTGENRVLTHFGLQRLNRAPGPGLWALIECSKRPAPLGVSDLVFGLGPLINAAGRLGDAREAVRLLRSADRDSALAQAAQLVRRNQERRQVDHDTAEAAKARFMALDDWQQRKSIVLFDPHWHKGIIGIAAGRMAETFHRPAVILTQSQGRAVGSARSIRGFDLYAALQGCADLFHSFGGHAHAAGMQMPVENLPDFVARFEAIAQAQISAAQQRPVLDISADLDLQDINAEFWQFLRRFEPFGPQNRNPVFRATGVVDSGESRLLSNNHVRLSLRQTGSRAVFKAIGFGLGERFEALRHRPFEIAYNIRQEQWRGQRQLSLEVKDMR